MYCTITIKSEKLLIKTPHDPLWPSIVHLAVSLLEIPVVERRTELDWVSEGVGGRG